MQISIIKEINKILPTKAEYIFDNKKRANKTQSLKVFESNKEYFISNIVTKDNKSAFKSIVEENQISFDRLLNFLKKNSNLAKSILSIKVNSSKSLLK